MSNPLGIPSELPETDDSWDASKALPYLLAIYENQRRHLNRADRKYRAEASAVSIGPNVPIELACFRTAAPMVRIASIAYADRVALEDVELENQDLQDPELSDWQDMREALVSAVAQAVLEAVAIGVGYIRQAYRSDGRIALSAVRGRDGAFLEDPDTGELLATMRVHRNPLDPNINRAMDSPTRVTIYTPGRANLFVKEGGNWVDRGSDPVPDGAILMRPLVNRARAGEPFGRAEARDLYDLQDQASRALTNLSIMTDGMAANQRVLIAKERKSWDGLSKGQVRIDDILALSGEDVRIDQWTASPLNPVIEAINHLYKEASAITGVPLSYWGIASDANPTSGDAIRENDIRLDIRCRRIAAQFSPAVEDFVNDLLAKLDIGTKVSKVRWADPSVPTPGAAADMVTKLLSVGPPLTAPLVDRDYAWNVLRMDPADRERIERAETRGLLDEFRKAADATEGAPPNSQGDTPGTGTGIPSAGDAGNGQPPNGQAPIPPGQ